MKKTVDRLAATSRMVGGIVVTVVLCVVVTLTVTVIGAGTGMQPAPTAGHGPASDTRTN